MSVITSYSLFYVPVRCFVFLSFWCSSCLSFFYSFYSFIYVGPLTLFLIWLFIDVWVPYFLNYSDSLICFLFWHLCYFSLYMLSSSSVCFSVFYCSLFYLAVLVLVFVSSFISLFLSFFFSFTPSFMDIFHICTNIKNKSEMSTFFSFFHTTLSGVHVLWKCTVVIVVVLM